MSRPKRKRKQPNRFQAGPASSKELGDVVAAAIQDHPGNEVHKRRKKVVPSNKNVARQTSRSPRNARGSSSSSADSPSKKRNKFTTGEILAMLRAARGTIMEMEDTALNGSPTLNWGHINDLHGGDFPGRSVSTLLTRYNLMYQAFVNAEDFGGNTQLELCDYMIRRYEKKLDAEKAMQSRAASSPQKRAAFTPEEVVCLANAVKDTPLLPNKTINFKLICEQHYDEFHPIRTARSLGYKWKSLRETFDKNIGVMMQPETASENRIATCNAVVAAYSTMEVVEKRRPENPQGKRYPFTSDETVALAHCIKTRDKSIYPGTDWIKFADILHEHSEDFHPTRTANRLRDRWKTLTTKHHDRPGSQSSSKAFCNFIIATYRIGSGGSGTGRHMSGEATNILWTSGQMRELTVLWAKYGSNWEKILRKGKCFPPGRTCADLVKKWEICLRYPRFRDNLKSMTVSQGSSSSDESEAEESEGKRVPTSNPGNGGTGPRNQGLAARRRAPVEDVHSSSDEESPRNPGDEPIDLADGDSNADPESGEDAPNPESAMRAVQHHGFKMKKETGLEYFRSKSYPSFLPFDERLSRSRYQAKGGYRKEYIYRDALRGTFGLELKVHNGRIAYKRLNSEDEGVLVVALNGFVVRENAPENSALDDAVKVITDTPVGLPLFVITAPLDTDFDVGSNNISGFLNIADLPEKPAKAKERSRQRQLQYDGSEGEGSEHGKDQSVAITQQDEIIDVDQSATDDDELDRTLPEDRNVYPELEAKYNRIRAANVKSQIAGMTMCSVVIEWAKPYFNTAPLRGETIKFDVTWDCTIQDVLDHISGDDFSEFREMHSPLRFRQNLSAKWRIFTKATNEYSRPVLLNKTTTCEDAFLKCSLESGETLESLPLVVHPEKRRR